MLLFTFSIHFIFLNALQPEGDWNLLLLCSLLQNRRFKFFFFFLQFWQQDWALAHSPAHHINKPSTAVQHIWFGWYWGLRRFPYAFPLHSTPSPSPPTLTQRRMQKRNNQTNAPKFQIEEIVDIYPVYPILYLYCGERKNTRWNIDWARGKSPRDFLRAQAIFHHISWLKSQYRHS